MPHQLARRNNARNVYRYARTLWTGATGAHKAYKATKAMYKKYSGAGAYPSPSKSNYSPRGTRAARSQKPKAGDIFKKKNIFYRGVGTASGGSGAVTSFRNRRKKRSSKSSKTKRVDYLKMGSVKTYENGWTASNSECLYTGSGASMDRIFHACGRAIFLCIAKRLSITIESWRSAPTFGSWNCDFKYTMPGVAGVQSVTCSISTTQDWDDIALNFVTVMKATFNGVWTGQFHEIEVVNTTNFDKAWVQVLIPLSEFYFDVNTSIKVMCQNQTKSDGDSNDTTVVNANPLECMWYVVNGNKFTHKAGKTTNDPIDLFSAKDSDGSIIRQYGAGAALPLEVKKLAQPSFFNYLTSSQKFRMAPGETIIKRVSRQQAFNFNRMMNALQNAFGDVEVTFPAARHHLGVSILLAGEKTIDTRNEGAEPVTFGIQTDQTYSVAYHFGARKKTLKFNDVTATASTSI